MTRPSRLRAQQRAFAALITSPAPNTGTPLLRPLAGRAPHLAAYHHAYRARLVAALRANFPVLHRVLGDEGFAEVAMAYLADHPSRQPSIRWFGDQLASWLAARPDALPHPALVDLAAMEWALGTSFDAADALPLSHAALAALPAARWPALRFAAHPSVALLQLRWAIEPIWQALTDDETAVTAEPTPCPHQLLIWRRGLETCWRSLDTEEAALLAACLAGKPFIALCEQAAESGIDGAAERVALALRRWIGEGLLRPARRQRNRKDPP
jgi:hypothetical protein